MNVKKEILLVEDDPGHAALIKKHLRGAGLTNSIHQFEDGQAILDFLFDLDREPCRVRGESYLLILDIRLPKVDGVEVLRQIKKNGEIKKLPVIMLTTTGEPEVVERCYLLGCNQFIIKSIDYEEFSEKIRNLGLFLRMVETPKLNGFKS